MLVLSLRWVGLIHAVLDLIGKCRDISMSDGIQLNDEYEIEAIELLRIDRNSTSSGQVASAYSVCDARWPGTARTTLSIAF